MTLPRAAVILGLGWAGTSRKAHPPVTGPRGPLEEAELPLEKCPRVRQALGGLVPRAGLWNEAEEKQSQGQLQSTGCRDVREVWKLMAGLSLPSAHCPWPRLPLGLLHVESSGSWNLAAAQSSHKCEGRSCRGCRPGAGVASLLNIRNLARPGSRAEELGIF